jgi:hemoglobin
MGSGCATTAPVSQPKASLYERLGGQGAIAAVVDEFIARMAKDTRVNTRFTNVDMPRFRRLLIEQLCQGTGGPCQYTGRDMKVTHAGMNISDDEFTATVEALKGALDQFKVPAAEQGELLAVLGPMKPDIVEGSRTPVGAAGAVAVPGAPTSGPPGAAAPSPIIERAAALREAASLLDKAEAARARQSRSLAEQLFSSAELIAGSGAVADLAPLFREGAPPRITTPPVQVPLNSPAQPAAVGNSDDEETDGGAAAKPQRGSLSGIVNRAAGTAEGLTVVTLEPLSGRVRRRPPRQRVIEQRQRTFAPRVLAVPVGSSVSFPNFDTIFHNVFSRSEAKPFDLGLYKGGQARELVFDRPGVVRIGCNLHASMAAFVVVVEAPHYVIAAPDGRFSFRSVAPGRYRLRAYNDRTEAPVEQTVAINAGANDVKVQMGPAAPTQPLADKFGQPRTAIATPPR